MSLQYVSCLLLPIQSYDFRSIRVDSPLLLIVNGKKQVMKSQSAAFVTYKPQSEWKPRDRTYIENIESNEGSVFSICIYCVLFLFVRTGKLFVHIFFKSFPFLIFLSSLDGHHCLNCVVVGFIFGLWKKQ